MVIRGSHGLWVLKDIITFERCNIFFLQLFFLACFNFPSVIHVGFLGQLLWTPEQFLPLLGLFGLMRKQQSQSGANQINWIESWLTRSFQTEQGASFGRRSWAECGTTIPALRQFCEIWIVKKKKKNDVFCVWNMQNPSAHEEDTSKTDSGPEGVKVSSYISLHFYFKLWQLRFRSQLIPESKRKSFSTQQYRKSKHYYIAWQKWIAM